MYPEEQHSAPNLQVPTPPDINQPAGNLKPSASRKAIAAILLLAVGFFSGMQVGKKGFVFQPKTFKIINQNEAPKDVDYQLLWDAIATVNEKYIENKPTPLQYLYGAVKGAVAAAGDPYTTFFEPSDLENFKTDLKGSFDGIGAEIGKKDGNIVIVAPLDGTPAKRAGLMPQDVIVKVDGESTTDWSTEQAVSKIRGKKGTTVVLTIARESRTEPFDVKIVRDTIEIKSVKWEFKDVTTASGTKKIGIITISKFGDDTKPLFDKAVNDILSSSVSGLVVDLRNNPGGYLQTAVDVASAWLDNSQTVVTEEKSQGTPDIYKANGNPRLRDMKTIVLINGGSASAAEILAGALRDYQKAQLLGEKSFGKGSVQELVDLPKGGAVKVTVAKWITPSGKNLNKDGLNPDVEVKLTEQDITAGKDLQMDKALEEVTK